MIAVITIVVVIKVIVPVIIIIVIRIAIAATVAVEFIPTPKDCRISCPSNMDSDGQLPLAEQYSNHNSSACSANGHPPSLLSVTITMLPIIIISTTTTATIKTIILINKTIAIMPDCLRPCLAAGCSIRDIAD